MYKTIVVHVDGSSRQPSRLRVAAGLALAHDAHLVGTGMTGMPFFDYAMLTGSMGSPMPDGYFETLRNEAHARLAEFTEQARRLGVTDVETRMVEDDPRFALLMQSRYADLTVLSQEAAGDPLLPPRMRGLPEYVALHGCRPVLVVPEHSGEHALRGTAVVGWNGSMQAVRAIDAAMPLLQAAGSVKLAVINPDQLANVHGEEPGADIALYLARHGLAVEVIVERTSASTGEALVAVARTYRAGLLVTGAYGHSRYREWVLGGATRALLGHCPIPLLLAH
jgi:nucleotide-binding universal stress UspA family protein